MQDVDRLVGVEQLRAHRGVQVHLAATAHTFTARASRDTTDPDPSPGSRGGRRSGGGVAGSADEGAVRAQGDGLQQRVDLRVVADLGVAAQEQRDVILRGVENMSR